MLVVFSRRFAIVAFFVAVAFSRIGAGLAADAPLNLLIISTDEHHFSTLGCYGGTAAKTPNILFLFTDDHAPHALEW